MASEIRDFKSFRSFGGKVANNVYEFPVLTSIDKAGRTRLWKISIYLTTPEFASRNWAQDWVFNPAETREIRDEYFDVSEIPLYAVVFATYGITGGKMSLPPPTIITEGPKGLVGKVNARNAFTQALIDARNKWLEKQSAGYFTADSGNAANQSQSSRPSATAATAATAAPARESGGGQYFAMSAEKYVKIGFPCYSQPKLDGVRCLMTRPGSGPVLKLSREHKTWPGFAEFDTALAPAFDAHPGLYLDGEFYVHGLRLQEISGIARNAVKKRQLEYHVFDAFIGTEAGISQPFSERLELLKSIFRLVKSPIVIQVDTEYVTDQASLDKIYEEYLDFEYEGQMVRTPSGPYLTSKYREMRSRELLKRKIRVDAEFAIVRVECGKNGRAAGAFQAICVTPGGIEFAASTKDMTFEAAKELYREAVAHPDRFIGKMATIEFEVLSKTGVPLKPKFVQVRESL